MHLSLSACLGLSCDRSGLSCDRFGLSCDRSGLSCDRSGLSWCDRSTSAALCSMDFDPSIRSRAIFELIICTAIFF